MKEREAIMAGILLEGKSSSERSEFAHDLYSKMHPKAVAAMEDAKRRNGPAKQQAALSVEGSSLMSVIAGDFSLPVDFEVDRSGVERSGVDWSFEAESFAGDPAALSPRN